MSQETPKAKSNPFFKAGEAAPEATLVDESGKAITLASFWKEKPTLVVFLRHFG